ncbi:MAG: EamA family transporter [Rhodobacteraceae bacterium]|nr:EamA family transporter [Paracoccaceae bacterium]
MSAFVFAIVIAAAVLHAVWNAVVKDGGDKFVAMTGMILGQVPIALLCLVIWPMPAAESWLYLAAGVVIHTGYQFFLALAYKHGDFSQVYPLARGVAPLLVAAVSVLFLGVELSRAGLFGISMIGIGIMSLAFARQADGRRNGKAAGLALITGCFIASYSLVDGFGARLSGAPMTYYAGVALGSTVGFLALMAVWRPGVITQTLQVHKGRSLFAGSASFVAFAIVIWAFTQAPIALVTALRETSIIFAIFIGLYFFGEKLGPHKIMSIMAVVLGAVVMKLA